MRFKFGYYLDSDEDQTVEFTIEFGYDLPSPRTYDDEGCPGGVIDIEATDVNHSNPKIKALTLGEFNRRLDTDRFFRKKVTEACELHLEGIEDPKAGDW